MTDWLSDWERGAMGWAVVARRHQHPSPNVPPLRRTPLPPLPPQSTRKTWEDFRKQQKEQQEKEDALVGSEKAMREWLGGSACLLQAGAASSSAAAGAWAHLC
jgi:hypothetical protein